MYQNFSEHLSGIKLLLFSTLSANRNNTCMFQSNELCEHPIQQSNSRVFVSIADNRTEPQELQNDLKIVLVQREIQREIDPAEICRMLRIMTSLAIIFKPCDSMHFYTKK